MNQQPSSAPKPKVSKWLWITLIVVAVAGAGFFSWYYLMGPGKKVATSTTTPTSTPTTITTTPSTSTTTPSTTTTTPSTTTPEKVAENFYNYYLGLTNPNGQLNAQGAFQSSTAPFKLKVGFSDYLTATLISNLESEFNNPTNNVDPILGAQDTPPKITYDVATITNNTATSVVNMQFTPVHKVTLGYIKENGKWKISSISPSL